MPSGSSHSRLASPLDLVLKPSSFGDHKPVKKQESDDVAIYENVKTQVDEQDSVPAVEAPVSPLKTQGKRPKGACLRWVFSITMN